MAWRFKLPNWMFGIFTVNFLEFLANVIMHLITVPSMPPMSCYLNLPGSTSIVGWLYKSSFHPDTQYKHSALVRRHAEIDMEYHLIGYSQHVQGICKCIPDCLSCDFHLSEDQLTFPFLSLFPNKMMRSFRFSPILEEIISWVFFLVCQMHRPRMLRCQPIRSTTSTGPDGKHLLEEQDSQTHSLMDFNPTSRSGCKKGIQGGTAQATINNVAATFSACGKDGPARDTTGKTHLDINQQLRGYRKEDPPPRQEKALPVVVYRWILCHAKTKEELARAHLLAGAFFFAMRSCEYSKLGGSEERRTITIRLQDI
eukprot:9283207-Ditylum_brightwellii.AAC.1